MTTTTYLLDADVLIALTIAEHEHHDRASTWAATTDRFALCPIVEGALVRFLVRIGERTQAATQVLRALHAMPRCEFWPDSLPYTDAPLDHVRGHRQVIDAYLAGLAASRPHAQLATFDTALAHELPAQCHLVP